MSALIFTLCKSRLTLICPQIKIASGPIYLYFMDKTPSGQKYANFLIYTIDLSRPEPKSQTLLPKTDPFQNYLGLT
jgi:hypothetical protein